MVLRRMFSLGGRRLADDRGSVGILVALVMFFVIGMLSMTYNSARMSTEKIRLQNAVDAAALEHAAWQARGMNMIQNLNNEAFTALCFCDEVIAICCGMNVVRAVLETSMRVTPPPFNAILKVLEVLAYSFIRAALFVTKWISRGLVGGVIYILQEVCRFTPIVGYMTAQQLAAENGAEPLGGQNAHIDIGKLKIGAYAVGIATKDISTIFVLPVERETFKGKKDEEKAPFITDNKGYKDEMRVSNALSRRKDLVNAIPSFDFKPMVSKKLEKAEGAIKWVMPAPCLWLCYKGNSQIRLMPLTVWDAGFDTKKDKKSRTRLDYGHGGFDRIIALGAAQCITGDIVKQSVTAAKDKFCTQRPAGLGAGATAKLVPVSSVMPSPFGDLIYH